MVLYEQSCTKHHVQHTPHGGTFKMTRMCITMYVLPC